MQPDDRSSPGWCSPPVAPSGSASPSNCCPTATGRCSTTCSTSARACAFDQLVCVIGGGATDVRDKVDLQRRRRSSRTALRRGLLLVDRRRAGRSRRARRRARADARRSARRHVRRSRRRSSPAAATRRWRPAVRRWPRASARVRAQPFGELAQLHGDKGVWKLLDRPPPKWSTSRCRADPARRRHLGGLRRGGVGPVISVLETIDGSVARGDRIALATVVETNKSARNRYVEGGQLPGHFDALSLREVGCGTLVGCRSSPSCSLRRRLRDSRTSGGRTSSWRCRTSTV